MMLSVAVKTISDRNLCQSGFMNGRKVNFRNETKEVNDLLNFQAVFMNPLFSVHANLRHKRPSNVKQMAGVIASRPIPYWL